MNYFMKYVAFLVLIVVFSRFRTAVENRAATTISAVTRTYQNEAKTKAFEVLKNKCNSCHATKKRTDIFTLNNIDSLAPNIYEQVFLKRKMPKGKKTKLTPNESMALKNWLTTVLEDSKTKKSR